MLWVLTGSAVCRADLLANGGFEEPVLAADSFLTIDPGMEPAGFDWVVTAGTVDIGSLPLTPFVLYAAFEGSQALDLNGTSRGTVSQDFTTVAGRVYRLEFVYADNPFETGVSSADIVVSDVVSAGSLLTDSVTHSTSVNSPTPDADWMFYSDTFTATGALTRLVFESTSASGSASGGVLLDAVSVSEVPEPGSLAVCGLGGWLLFRRRAVYGRVD